LFVGEYPGHEVPFRDLIVKSLYSELTGDWGGLFEWVCIPMGIFDVHDPMALSMTKMKLPKLPILI